MTGLTVVGAGDVLSRYVLGAAATGEFRLEDVVDVRPAEEIRRVCELAGCRDEVRVHSLGAQGSRTALREVLAGMDRAQPVIIATPPAFHVDYALAALEDGFAVAIEKPYAVSEADVRRLDRWVHRHGMDRLFMLGYYALEKALPLLVLVRAGNVPEPYADCVEPRWHAGRWREVRERLGALRILSGCILEGTDTKATIPPDSWLLDRGQGGISIDLFYHLASLLALFARPTEVRIDDVALLSQYAIRSAAETLVVAALRLDGRASARLIAAKYVSPGVNQRWVRAEFEGGRALMDLESKTLRVSAGSDESVFRVREPAPYATQFRIFAAKLRDPSVPTELDLFRSALQMTLAIRAAGLQAGITSSDTLRLGRDAIEAVLNGEARPSALRGARPVLTGSRSREH